MLRDRGIPVHERHIEASSSRVSKMLASPHVAEVTPVGQIGDYSFEVGALTREISGSV